MPPPEDAVIDFEVPEEPDIQEVRTKFPKWLPEIGGEAGWNAFDARVITYTGEYAITSSNMNYIPSYIFGEAKLVARDDGRWGYLDPFRTPQEYSHTFVWAPLVACQGTISKEDFPNVYIWRSPMIHETTEHNGVRRLS